ncbi:hypothetical protein TRFO_10327 [Tritrichomonas foetus]|uniref:Uncharacterized protein n=1 Tax=Tritrichomonas foetus TaxID=1144522 RepID=A0A1J4JBS3_9EUKA|nr:hypothetical protein TRFO_10327 [Tritrichomonas foetus]|eukprot:OHS95695.1 hypothetical protein TRFO_10327 [Tritrichomonas foetus]
MIAYDPNQRNTIDKAYDIIFSVYPDKVYTERSIIYKPLSLKNVGQIIHFNTGMAGDQNEANADQKIVSFRKLAC